MERSNPSRQQYFGSVPVQRTISPGQHPPSIPGGEGSLVKRLFELVKEGDLSKLKGFIGNLGYDCSGE